MARTSLEEKRAQLEAALKETNAKISRQARKERNSQLMSFGIMLETKYKTLPETERAKIRAWAENLDARNESRVLVGFSRLESGLTRKEISSEPPSQQPEAEAAQGGQGPVA